MGKRRWPLANLRAVSPNGPHLGGPPRNADNALPIGASGWSILVTGLGNAIPEGDDLLMATLAARMDRGGVAAGTVYPERAVDSCLTTQNACGGFGLGVHTGSDRESSACEDIDSIDPPARLLFRDPPYRRDDIRRALDRGAEIVLAAQAGDGGFQFVRGRRFEYGHPQLAADATEGAMFPTWFRTLTLAYLGKALPDSPLGRVPWRFGNCPGIQFWRYATPAEPPLPSQALYTRGMSNVPAAQLLDRITIDPGVCHGKPCIRHLRYPVEMLLDLLSGGMTPEQILDDYRDLERDDILAVLAFAARLSRVKSMDVGVS